MASSHFNNFKDNLLKKKKKLLKPEVTIQSWSQIYNAS